MESEEGNRRSLRELAAEAVQRTREQEGVPENMPLSEARRIAEEKKKREVFRARVVELVGEGHRVEVEQDGKRLISIVEGLRFIESRDFVLFDEMVSVALVGECPKCGQAAESNILWKRERLYEMIAEFEPSYNHSCPAKHPKLKV